MDISRKLLFINKLLITKDFLYVKSSCKKQEINTDMNIGAKKKGYNNQDEHNGKETTTPKNDKIKFNGDKRSYNIEIFKDTTKICKENEIVKKYIENSIKNQSFISETNTQMKVNGVLTNIKEKDFNNNDGSLILEDKPVIRSAIDCLKDTNYKCKVAILNFADWTDTGGLVNEGEVTQEESICRCTTLYQNISNKNVNEYYKSHKEKYDKDIKSRTYANNDIIYSPNVLILKDDNIPENVIDLDIDTKNNISVITCAAPWNDHDEPILRNEQIEKIHIEKAKRILNVALTDNVDIIILGAYGCGAFNNKPEDVSKAYKQVLINDCYLKYFKKVIFALPTFGSKSGQGYINYVVFNKTLSAYTKKK